MESLDKPQNQEEDECYATVEEYFIDMCRYGEFEEVKDCIKDISIKHFELDSNSNTAMHMASANGHTEILKLLLDLLKTKPNIEQQKIINQQNIDGNTALHWATLNNQLSCVKLLIENKADCNIKNSFEKNPLDEAIQMSHIDIADIIAPNIVVDLKEYDDVAQEDYQIFEKDEDDYELEQEISSIKINENVNQEEEKKIDNVKESEIANNSEEEQKINKN